MLEIKYLYKRMTILLLIFSISFGLADSKNAMAGTTSIYKKALSGYLTTDTGEKIKPKSFLLLDINKDGKKELIVKDSKASEAFATKYIFTINAGKVICKSAYYENYGTAGVVYSKKLNRISTSTWIKGNAIGEKKSIYILKKGKLKSKGWIFSGSKENGKMVYKKGANDKTSGKKISKKEYEKLEKKYTQSFKKYSFKSNTEKNRKSIK